MSWQTLEQKREQLICWKKSDSRFTNSDNRTLEKRI